MNYWQFKFTDKLWKGFEKLEVGDVFDTTITEVHTLADCIGDIVFWFRTDRKKGDIRGIYFVCEIISDPMENEEYYSGNSINMRILKTLVDKPFVLEDNGFKDFLEKVNKKFLAGTRYKLEDEDRGEELYKKLSVENIESLKKVKIDTSLLKTAESIKSENIEEGAMFNPFLDMGLIKGEVKHLRFLANLFNPNGTHFQNDLFLKQFVKILLEFDGLKDNKYLKNFDTKNAKVLTEKTTDDNKRIDIWIEDDDFIIAIEGKVEASDTKGQLMNYDRYLKEKCKKEYVLIFLTKSGSIPEHEYPEGLKFMSFKTDIYDFIDRALEEKLHPKVRSMLIEYINSLMVYLHNLNPTWKYRYDLISEIVKNKDNFEKYKGIKNKYYYDRAKYRFSVVEDIAEIFNASKALIEWDFFGEIDDNLLPIIEKYGFEFDGEYSNIFKCESKDEKISYMVDVKNAYIQRKERSCAKDGRVQLAYFTDSHILAIQNNNSGFWVVLFGSDEKEITKKLVIDCNEFYADNISNFLDEKHSKEQVKRVVRAVEDLLLEKL